MDRPRSTRVRRDDHLADAGDHPLRPPQARAIQAIATGVPLLLVLYAATYNVIAHNQPDSFSEALSLTGALYFTITVFASVGSGVPWTELGRIVVMTQMIFGRIARCSTPNWPGAQSHRRDEVGSASFPAHEDTETLRLPEIGCSAPTRASLHRVRLQRVGHGAGRGDANDDPADHSDRTADDPPHSAGLAAPVRSATMSATPYQPEPRRRQRTPTINESTRAPRSHPWRMNRSRAGADSPAHGHTGSSPFAGEERAA